MKVQINYEDIAEQITADLAEDVGLELTTKQFHQLLTQRYLLLSSEEIMPYIKKLFEFMNNHEEPLVWRCDFIRAPKACMISMYVKTPYIIFDGAPDSETEE